MRKAGLFLLVLVSTTTVSAAVLPLALRSEPSVPSAAQGISISVPSVALGISAPSAAPFDSRPARDARGPLAQGRLEFQSAPSASYRGDWTADTRNTWRENDGEPRVQFNLRTTAGDSRMGFGVRLRDLAGLSSAAANTASDVQFSWTREAGTFRFTGSFDNGRGRGTYTFTPDQTFIANMASIGYKNLSTDDVLHLAVIDVTVAHVRGLAEAGYANLPLDDVIATRIHRVTPEFIRDLATLGYMNIDIDDLVAMSIHGATPENIRALQAEGIRGIDVDELIAFRIHKVTPDFIKAMDALGFRGMDLDDLVAFRIHGVTPEFIKSIRDAGFQSISEDQLIAFRIHKVDAQFIRDARADGYAIQTPDDAVDLAIHGLRWKRRGL